MLGDLVKQVVSPVDENKDDMVSYKLRDAIVTGWKSNREGGRRPTLKKQKDVWREHWAYASGTKYWCPRMKIIEMASEQIIESSYDVEDLWNFAQGNAYHTLFQSEILSSLSKILLGTWERFVKGDDGLYLRETEPSDFKTDEAEYERKFGIKRDIVRGWGRKPDGKDWVYREAKVRLPDSRIVVKFDGLLDWGNGELEVFELKSEREQARDSLNPFMGGKPRAYHVEQCQLGMLATGVKKARLVYLFKGGYSFKTALIEHEIVFDQKLALSLLERAKSMRDAVLFFDDLTPEERLEKVQDLEWLDDHYPRVAECPMKSKGNARYCAGRDICFPDGYRKKKSSKK